MAAPACSQKNSREAQGNPFLGERAQESRGAQKAVEKNQLPPNRLNPQAILGSQPLAAAVCCFPRRAPSRLRSPVCRDGVALQQTTFARSFVCHQRAPLSVHDVEQVVVT